MTQSIWWTTISLTHEEPVPTVAVKWKCRRLAVLRIDRIPSKRRLEVLYPSAIDNCHTLLHGGILCLLSAADIVVSTNHCSTSKSKVMCCSRVVESEKTLLECSSKRPSPRRTHTACSVCGDSFGCRYWLSTASMILPATIGSPKKGKY